MSKLRVSWTPQIGSACKPFIVPVSSPEEGYKVMAILSIYDEFQYKNKIKPDFCNSGSLEVFNEELGEWVEWEYEDDDNYFDNLNEYIEDFRQDSACKELMTALLRQVTFA